MFRPLSSFSGFSVNDIQQAKAFYTDVLGLEVKSTAMGEGVEILILHVPGEGKVVVYPKDDHIPATFTVLNFVVEHIDEALEDLKSKGVTFEKYESMTQDEKGVLRGLSHNMGPDIAWFKDPSGNILSILQEK